MATRTTLRPLKDAEFSSAHAFHLLSRGGFGGTPDQVEAVRKLGPEAAAAFLVDYGRIDNSEMALPSYDTDIRIPRREVQAIVQAAYRQNQRDAEGAGAEVPAELTGEALRDEIRDQNMVRLAEDREQMHRLELWWLSWLLGSPRPMQEKLTLFWHGHFASNHRSVRDSYLMLQQNELFRRHANGSFADLAHGIVHDPAMIRFLNNDSNRKGRPNENLARELMELFTLGPGNYTEQDIRQGARALTGNTVDDDDFRFNARQHDAGEKLILGQRGDWDADDFVDILLRQPACSRFVAMKLYRQFVSDMHGGPTGQQNAIVTQLAEMLRRESYQLAPVLRTLLASEHFYDAANRGNMVKSPAQLLVGTARSLRTPLRSLVALAEAMAAMGQRLFEPPSVAGWDGGRAWVNTSTLFVRQNTTLYLITGRRPADGDWTTDEIDYDPTFLLGDLTGDNPASIADRLLTAAMGPEILPARRAAVTQFLTERSEPRSPQALVATLALITTMPEYQLC